jgi:hypothetical protein
MIMSRKMRWAGYVVRIEKRRGEERREEKCKQGSGTET